MKSFLIPTDDKNCRLSDTSLNLKERIQQCLQTAEVIDQGKQHDPDDQTDADLHPPTLNPLRQGATTHPLDQIKQQMPTIQYGNGKQIENPRLILRYARNFRKSPSPDSAEAPATLAMVIGPLKFFTESSPNSIFFSESRVSRLMAQVWRRPSTTPSTGP